ncbi:MAG: MBL fold metallo-hydrolase, partial [Promethearchaeota archaeon]
MESFTEKNWYKVEPIKEDLIVIREQLDELDPRFHTHFTNLYLLLGSEKALLIDTGAGVFPLKPIVDELIGTRELMVLNTHGHWDHVGNNSQFEKVYIHEKEARLISTPINISNIADSEKTIAKIFKKNNYLLMPTKHVESLKDGDMIDLGNITLEVIHAPGHSPGCIVLSSNRKELFIGDIAHEGAVFLPKKKNFPTV